jgi:peptidoglycan L-alanyl-D-glutamate endopeptidase CwlK
MRYQLGQRSRERLQGVHPDLVRVVERAIGLTSVDFTVLEGLRTTERQKTLVAAGASKTMNSRHITGHAVDLGAYVDGQVDWSWPLYERIAAAMKLAAKELSVSIVWGGDWRTFKDGPHFELDRKAYPPV